MKLCTHCGETMYEDQILCIVCGHGEIKVEPAPRAEGMPLYWLWMPFAVTTGLYRDKFSFGAWVAIWLLLAAFFFWLRARR